MVSWTPTLSEKGRVFETTSSSSCSPLSFTRISILCTRCSCATTRGRGSGGAAHAARAAARAMILSLRPATTIAVVLLPEGAAAVAPPLEAVGDAAG